MISPGNPAIRLADLALRLGNLALRLRNPVPSLGDLAIRLADPVISRGDLAIKLADPAIRVGDPDRRAVMARQPSESDADAAGATVTLQAAREALWATPGTRKAG